MRAVSPHADIRPALVIPAPLCTAGWRPATPDPLSPLNSAKTQGHRGPGTKRWQVTDEHVSYPGQRGSHSLVQVCNPLREGESGGFWMVPKDQVIAEWPGGGGVRHLKKFAFLKLASNFGPLHLISVSS